MKPIMEGWRDHIAESPQTSAACDKVKPTEPGKRFEWVVVYRARTRFGGEPLPNEEYECCPAWSSQPYPTKKPTTTLGDLADKAIDLAQQSGVITDEDFAAANIQTMGSQVPAGGTRPIEIKTDIVFGEKTISVKLSGDVQGQTSEATSTVEQLRGVFAEVFEQWREAEKEAAEKTIQEIEKDLQKITDKMLRVGKEVRITQKRTRQLINKDIQSTNDATKKKALARRRALLDAEIIDAEGNVVLRRLNQDLWNKNHSLRLTREINRLLDLDKDFRHAFTDEVLTGRRMFRDSPGAAAEYILSPDEFFVLAPGAEGYEDSIGVFSKAMTLGIRPKGGRTILPRVTLGVKPAYRFDIKKKAVTAAKQAIEREKQQKIDAAE